jgi:hypothetical protein
MPRDMALNLPGCDKVTVATDAEIANATLPLMI